MRFALPLLLAWSTLQSCGRGGATPDDGTPTWSGQVARLVHEHCAACHHPGEAAPFPLLEYEDVCRRAKQIGLVTRDRIMPPWLPDSSLRSYVGDRSLSREQVDLLQRWIEAGAPLGDASAAPAPPEFPQGWRLGPPDLVVRMPGAFRLQAEGRDVYRNFVLSRPLAPGSPARYVRAVEWRIDDRTVVHHAGLFVDRSGGSRALEAADPVPGYGGMSARPAQVPDGLFVGWAPGKQPRFPTRDLAWKLDDRTDLVVQLHMRPTGKVEEVSVTLGLYLAQEPPRETALGLRLLSFDIDIPPGEANYVVADEYALPVPVEVLGLYPHAHYLGRDLHGWAELPSGERVELIRIRRWDFNWQDEYELAEPIALPRGSVLRMEFVYDNSAENELNPASPPKHVRYGEQSDDEMAELLLIVVPAPDDLPVLWRDFAWKVHADAVARVERLAAEEPDAVRWQAQLGQLALKGRDYPEAIARYEWVLARRPGVAAPLANLGHAQLLAGRTEEAIASFRACLDLEPAHVAARAELGRCLVAQQELEAAQVELERALTDLPEFGPALLGLAELALARGDGRAAVAAYERVLRANPEESTALCSLGELVLAQGEQERAARLAQAALEAYPDESRAHRLLGLVLERDDPCAALAHLETARRLEPTNTAYEIVYRRVEALCGALEGE